MGTTGLRASSRSPLLPVHAAARVQPHTDGTYLGGRQEEGETLLLLLLLLLLLQFPAIAALLPISAAL